MFSNKAQSCKIVSLNRFLLFFMVISLISCQKIDENQLKIIDGIQLGTTYPIYKNNLDSLGIWSETFYTMSLFSTDDLDEVKSNQITAYISDIFDLSDYKNNNTNHYAILYPVKVAGTDNIIELNALIGHTSNALMVGSGTVYDLTKEFNIKTFNQNIATSLLKEIKDMLTLKYGAPHLNSYESTNNYFYIIENNRIAKYYGHKDWKGRVTKWETEFLSIELFEGLSSVNAKYSPNGYLAAYWPGEKKVISEFNKEKGESPCVTYVYIKYEIKPDIIKKLGLDISSL